MAAVELGPCQASMRVLSSAGSGFDGLSIGWLRYWYYSLGAFEFITVCAYR